MTRLRAWSSKPLVGRASISIRAAPPRRALVGRPRSWGHPVCPERRRRACTSTCACSRPPPHAAAPCRLRSERRTRRFATEWCPLGTRAETGDDDRSERATAKRRHPASSFRGGTFWLSNQRPLPLRTQKWSPRPLRKQENRATARFLKPSAGLEPATPSLPSQSGQEPKRAPAARNTCREPETVIQQCRQRRATIGTCVTHWMPGRVDNRERRQRAGPGAPDRTSSRGRTRARRNADRYRRSTPARPGTRDRRASRRRARWPRIHPAGPRGQGPIGRSFSLTARPEAQHQRLADEHAQADQDEGEQPVDHVTDPRVLP